MGLDYAHSEDFRNNLRRKYGSETLTQPPADDPMKVDPKHYKVEFENELARVVRIS